jgi:hypothetical protein
MLFSYGFIKELGSIHLRRIVHPYDECLVLRASIYQYSLFISIDKLVKNGKSTCLTNPVQSSFRKGRPTARLR